MDHLKVMGCLYFEKRVQDHNKFVARETAAVMMGYSKVRKSYILYDFTNQVFFLNRDVNFKQNIFSFKHKGYLQPSLSPTLNHKLIANISVQAIWRLIP